MTGFLDAINLVAPTIEETQQIANDALLAGNLALDDLQQFVQTLDTDPITVSIPTNPNIVSAFNLPPTPIPPNINLVFSDLPAEPNPGLIRTIDLSSIPVPVFTATEPTANAIGRPTIDTIPFTAVEPTINTAYTLPAQPSTTLPNVPAFRPINIPIEPTITIPSFTAILPDVSSISPPNLTFTWAAESPYSDTLLTALKTELLSRIQNGGTGLNPVVEQAIYDRARDRDRRDSLTAEDEVLRAQTARGWSRPSGSAFAALEEVVQKSQDKISELNREIMIKQADLEQKNIEFAIQTTLALEQSLIQENNNIMERAFKARQFVQQVAVDIYNAQVAQLNLELEAYKAFAVAYELQLRAELSKVEIFKAEIEAQGLISQINQDDLKLYLGQVDGIKASAEIYNIIVSSINTQINAENLKLELFKSQIQSYTARNEAERVKLEVYSEDIKAEALRYGLYESQVKAFVSRIEGYGKQVDAQNVVTQSDISVEEQRLKRYLAQLEAVLKEVQTRSEYYKAASDIYTGQTRIFESQVNAESSRLNVELKRIENDIQNASVIGQVAIENARLAITGANNEASLIASSLEKIAELNIQIGASAMSSLNIGSQISGQAQDTFNQNFNTDLP